LEGIPKVLAGGQGGLPDVAVDPRFTENRLVYVSSSEPEGNGAAGTSVARGRLAEAGPEDVQVIYRQQPKISGPNHFGSRLVFARDGTLFITQGDRFAYGEQVIVKGLGPSFGHTGTGIAKALRSIHRPANFGLSSTARTRRRRAKSSPSRQNYGWPIITMGLIIQEQRSAKGTAKSAMEQPVYYWDPVIAPSGMIFYTGDVFPDWRGKILVGSLTPGLLVRLVMKDGRVAREERYLRDLNERIRDVRQGPDGSVYLLTDSLNGRLLRVTPGRR
jgi:aldose sugar dehydrogenase